MAKLPTKEENAREVLKAFEHFKVKPGEVLSPGNFTISGTQHDMKVSEVSSGLLYGFEQGWFEEGPNNSVRLTDIGFAEI